MVIPLADDNSDRRLFPYVNITLIAFNVFVFVFLQGLGAPDNKFTYAWATVPREIVTGQDIVTEPRIEVDRATRQRIRYPGLEPTPISVYLTLLTSMFMHGSISHIAGNMLFLYIFGDNIEDHLGHLRYVVFYLVCGVLASLAHVFLTVQLYGLDSPKTLVPSLGASGAISGVLGAYLLLYPYRRVTVILVRILTPVPAFVAIGMWFVFQLIEGLGMLGGRGSGSVAYAAHVGGFVAGLLLIQPFSIGLDPADGGSRPYWDRDERW